MNKLKPILCCVSKILCIVTYTIPMLPIFLILAIMTYPFAGKKGVSELFSDLWVPIKAVWGDKYDK